MKVTYEVDGVAKTLHVNGLPLESALSLVPTNGSLLGVQYE